MATSVVAPSPAASAAPPPAAPAAAPATSLADLVAQSIVPLSTDPAAPPTPDGTPSHDVTAPDTQQAPALEPMSLPDDAAPPAVAAPATPDPNAPAVEEPLDFTGENLEPDSVDADGKRMFTTPTKWAKFQNAAKFVNALQEVMPEVTPSAVIDAIKHGRSAEAMMAKYQAAATDPSQIREIVDLFSGEIDGATPTPTERQSFGTLALNILDRLEKINPQAMQGVYRVNNIKTVEGLRARARALPQGQQREQAIALALRFEEAAFQKFTPRDQWLQSQPTDPIDQQRQQIARERQALADQQRQMQQTQAEQLQTWVLDQQSQSVMGVIGGVLGKLNGNAIAEKYRPQMEAEFLSNIKTEEDAHPEWAFQHQTLQQNALMQPNAQNIQALNEFRRSIAKRVVDRTARDVISKYNSIALQNNQVDKDRAQRPIVNTPSPNGAPTPAPNGAMESVMKQTDLKNAIRETIRQTAAGVRL